MCITVQLSMCSASSAATLIRYHRSFCLSRTFLIFFKSFLCAAFRVAVFAVQMVYYHASKDFASTFFTFFRFFLRFFWPSTSGTKRASAAQILYAPLEARSAVWTICTCLFKIVTTQHPPFAAAEAACSCGRSEPLRGLPAPGRFMILARDASIPDIESYNLPGVLNF